MSNEFAEYVHGQLADLGEVVFGRFFGGIGFKLGDVQFAMCMRNTLYFVVDGATRPRYSIKARSRFNMKPPRGSGWCNATTKCRRTCSRIATS